VFALDPRKSSGVAVKYLEIQRASAIPIAVLDEKNTWNVNKPLLEVLIKGIDPRAPTERIVREVEPDIAKFSGRIRLKLGGAWGDIIAFYILNDPLPRITNVIYILHMATYITSFTTATLPEIYTGSEEFLKLIKGVDTKDGAIEFLTRLLRRRYIPESSYAEALEAVSKRRDLTFSSLRDELERLESRVVMADYFVRGIPGVIARLQDIVNKYGANLIPREEVASLVGDIYTLTRGLEKALEEYRAVLAKLNDLLTTSGKTIHPEKVKKVIEDIAKLA